MRVVSDLKHTLVIEQKGVEYSILHDPLCPTYEYAEGPSGDGPIIDYRCGVGMHISDIGLEADLADEYDSWEDLPEGRYPLTFWSERHPSTPNSAEEWSAGLEVGDREA